MTAHRRKPELSSMKRLRAFPTSEANAKERVAAA